MILVIDNYDSFVYNLVQLLGMLGQEMKIFRNDQLCLEEVASLQPSAILLSPGPCGPYEAGICLDVIREFHGKIPILGICLGHQALGAALGGEIRRASTPMHGKTSPLFHTGEGLFQGLPASFVVCRYHSLVIEESTLPECLTPTAWSEEGELMAVQNVENGLYGVQFHPESLYTEYGMQLIENFLRETEKFWRKG